MLVSFTQTYDNRKDLLDCHANDKKLNELKNLCDLNIYSFHNTNDDVVEHFKKTNKVKNTEILRFGKMTYTRTIEKIIEKLETIKCTHFLFIQDDTFSADNNDINFNEFVSFVKTFKENFMYCFYYTDEFDCELPVLKQFDNLTIYENNSLNYKEGGMNDHSYICTFDMLKKIYDKTYIEKSSIWVAEGHLTRRFAKEKIVRHNGNRRIFQNYNIFGRNTHNRKKFIEILQQKNIYPIK